jgi:prolipoprotein diacylglyceryltransferase
VLAAIPSPGANGIHLGPLELHVYGVCYVVAIFAAIAITARRWTAQGGSRELATHVAVWGVPAGLVGGRLYSLATSWDEVPDRWWGPLAVWKGGLGIWAASRSAQRQASGACAAPAPTSRASSMRRPGPTRGAVDRARRQLV